jgi:hypothetical protein
MKRALGEILMSMGAIDSLKLKSALAYQRQWGIPLGKVLVENRLCSKELVLVGLAKQAGLAVIDLATVEPAREALALISHKVAEQHKVIGLKVEGKRQDVLVVAIAAPASIAALDAVRSVSGKSRVVAYLAADEAIERAIAQHYQGVASAAAPKEGNAAVPQSELEFEFG